MIDKSIIEDILSLGGEALKHIAGHRHGLKSHAKGAASCAARKLDLVSRDEFDAAFDMLAKARNMQEELSQRLSRVEAVLNLSSVKKTVKKKKSNLPSVKTKQKRTTRK